MDLKAALFRKQQEYRREKGGQEGRAEESRSVSDKVGGATAGCGGWVYSPVRWVGLQPGEVGGATAR